MRLELYKEYFCVEYCDKPSITIAKKALEEWRDHYHRAAIEAPEGDPRRFLYLGKREVLVDLLKHFENDK